MTIHNTGSLDAKYVAADTIGLVTQVLGAAAGSQRIYVNIDSVPPRAYSTKYHAHSQQEEFFLILEGSGTLRLCDAEHAVTKGDFIAKPAGRGIAHTFYNSGQEPLVILDVGTVEPEDTCYYPDEAIYLHKASGVRHVFEEGALKKDWTSNPNE